MVDATIKRTTASGDGFLRYNGDGYGDGATDGHPWAPSNKGTGHPWPVLAGERGQYEVDRGAIGSAVARLDAMRNMSSGVGLIPEQAWDLPDLAASPFGTDPTIASIGFRNGKPDGSASALTWSAGQFVRLTLDTAAGSILDRPTTRSTATSATPRARPRCRSPAPADSILVGNSVTVTGTTTPGNRVIVAATNIDTDFTTTLTSATVGARRLVLGHQSPLAGGTYVLNIVGHRARRAPRRATRAPSSSTSRRGTLVSASDDPDNDDNGPGNYAYPTDPAVPPRRLRHRAASRSTTPARRSSSACARAT